MVQFYVEATDLLGVSFQKLQQRLRFGTVSLGRSHFECGGQFGNVFHREHRNRAFVCMGNSSQSVPVAAVECGAHLGDPLRTFSQKSVGDFFQEFDVTINPSQRCGAVDCQIYRLLLLRRFRICLRRKHIKKSYEFLR